MMQRFKTSWDRASGLAAALVLAHGLIVLVGWWAGWLLFLAPPPRFVPMAPSTTLAFLALSSALLSRVAWGEHAEVRGAASTRPRRS
jgi:hypothetical protein